MQAMKLCTKLNGREMKKACMYSVDPKQRKKFNSWNFLLIQLCGSLYTNYFLVNPIQRNSPQRQRWTPHSVLSKTKRRSHGQDCCTRKRFYHNNTCEVTVCMGVVVHPNRVLIKTSIYGQQLLADRTIEVSEPRAGGNGTAGVTGYFVSPEILYRHAKYPRIYCTPLGYLVSPSHSVYIIMYPHAKYLLYPSYDNDHYAYCMLHCFHVAL